MQAEKYNELESRAAESGVADELKQLEARSRVRKEIDSMLRSGEAKTLTEEEIQLIESFRRFKLRMRKQVEMFTYQTRRPDGIDIVLDTAEIVTPAEAAAQE